MLYGFVWCVKLWQPPWGHEDTSLGIKQDNALRRAEQKTQSTWNHPWKPLLWISRKEIVNGGTFCYSWPQKISHDNPFLLPTSFCSQISCLIMLRHKSGTLGAAITGNKLLQAQADACLPDLESLLRRWTPHKEQRTTVVSMKGQLQSERHCQGATEEAKKHSRVPRIWCENTQEQGYMVDSSNYTCRHGYTLPLSLHSGWHGSSLGTEKKKGAWRKPYLHLKKKNVPTCWTRWILCHHTHTQNSMIITACCWWRWSLNLLERKRIFLN